MAWIQYVCVSHCVCLSVFPCILLWDRFSSGSSHSNECEVPLCDVVTINFTVPPSHAHICVHTHTHAPHVRTLINESPTVTSINKWSLKLVQLSLLSAVFWAKLLPWVFIDFFFCPLIIRYRSNYYSKVEKFLTSKFGWREFHKMFKEIRQKKRLYQFTHDASNHCTRQRRGQWNNSSLPYYSYHQSNPLSIKYLPLAVKFTIKSARAKSIEAVWSTKDNLQKVGTLLEVVCLKLLWFSLFPVKNVPFIIHHLISASFYLRKRCTKYCTQCYTK